MPCWRLQNVHELKLAAPPEPSHMPNIRLKYDGWLALPVAARQKLGLSTGDELEIEVINGTIVLRPARTAAGADRSPPSRQLQPWSRSWQQPNQHRPLPLRLRSGGRVGRERRRRYLFRPFSRPAAGARPQRMASCRGRSRQPSTVIRQMAVVLFWADQSLAEARSSSTESSGWSKDRERKAHPCCLVRLGPPGAWA